MITATRNGETSRVDFLVNRGGWFGKTWLVIANGASFVVEADNESDAVDELVDSKHYNRIEWPKGESEQEWTSYGGNCGLPYNSELIQEISRCSVNYFA